MRYWQGGSRQWQVASFIFFKHTPGIDRFTFRKYFHIVDIFVDRFSVRNPRNVLFSDNVKKTC